MCPSIFSTTTGNASTPISNIVGLAHNVEVILKLINCHVARRSLFRQVLVVIEVVVVRVIGVV